jgi:hypothetical protein
VAEPVQNLAPSVEHFGRGLAHAIGVRELAGAAPDRPQSGLMEGDLLRLCQSLQQRSGMKDGAELRLYRGDGDRAGCVLGEGGQVAQVAVSTTGSGVVLA